MIGTQVDSTLGMQQPIAWAHTRRVVCTVYILSTHTRALYTIDVYIGLSRLLELRKPEYDWGVGWGGMLTFM